MNLIPEKRRGQLLKLLTQKGIVRFMEAHSGLSALIVETVIHNNCGVKEEFDGIWISSLTSSVVKAKPNIQQFFLFKQKKN